MSAFGAIHGLLTVGRTACVCATAPPDRVVKTIALFLEFRSCAMVLQFSGVWTATGGLVCRDFVCRGLGVWGSLPRKILLLPAHAATRPG